MRNLTFSRNIYTFFLQRAAVSSGSAAKSPEIGSVKIPGSRDGDGDLRGVQTDRRRRTFLCWTGAKLAQKSRIRGSVGWALTPDLFPL